MAIPFSCTCGKKLQAKDEFAGRKMRCPNCKEVLAIPGPALKTQPKMHALAAETQPMQRPAAPRVVPTAKAPVPAADADFVRFVCSCGRKMKARANDAGSTIDCPTCGRELTIPIHDTEVPPEPKFGPVPVTTPATSRSLPAPVTSRQLSAPATARTAPPKPAGPVRRVSTPIHSDGLFTQSTTPWRSGEFQRLSGPAPREKPVRRLALRIVAVLLLVGGLAALGYFLPHVAGSGQGAVLHHVEFDYIPAAASSVVSVRVAKFAPENLEKPPSSILDFGRKINAPIGWNERDLERINVVLVPKPSVPGIVGVGKLGDKGKQAPPVVAEPPSFFVLYFVRTVRPYNQEDVLRRMLLQRQVKRYRQRTYFVDSSDKAVMFLDDRVFVVGTDLSVQLLLGPLHDGRKHVLRDALLDASQNDLVVAIDFVRLSALKQPLSLLVLRVDETLGKETRTTRLQQENVFQEPDAAEKHREQFDKGPVLPRGVQVVSKTAKVDGEKLLIDMTATNPVGDPPIWRGIEVLAEGLHPIPWKTPAADNLKPIGIKPKR